jgi:hypothetical protein
MKYLVCPVRTVAGEIFGIALFRILYPRFEFADVCLRQSFIIVNLYLHSYHYQLPLL